MKLFAYSYAVKGDKALITGIIESASRADAIEDIKGDNQEIVIVSIVELG